MTTKEAIDAIISNRPTSGYTVLCEALDMAIEALKANQWVSVEERLPTETDKGDAVDASKLCIVCISTPYGPPIISTDVTIRGEWCRNNPEFNIRVTHWMPLPSPPKRQKG